MYPKGVKRQLERLNALTTGPAALRVPPTVREVTLKFNSKVGESSHGAKQFWKTYLPPIQFYNPQLAISVQRTSDGAKPCVEVQFEDGSTEKIDAYGQPASELLSQLTQTLKAEPIPESEQTVLE